jgi:hypothetical protein
VPCPHPGLQVGGRCYWCCKQAATNGHRDRLSPEALAFVGFVTEMGSDTERTWIPAAARAAPSDQLLEALERRLDVAPNWFALARRILEDEKEES